MYARNSLAACGVGLLVATVAGGLLFPLTAAALSVARTTYGYDFTLRRDVWGTAALVTGWGLIALPLPVAWWLYTAPDRSRLTGLGMAGLPRLAGVRRAIPTMPGLRLGASTRRLVWLFVRQHRVVAGVLVANGLLAGGIFLIPDAPAAAIWPIVSLLAGVLAGVVTVADEQQAGAVRFWGERRLPAGRLWLAKVTLGLLLTGAVLVALLVPAVLAAVINPPRLNRPPGSVLGAVLHSGVLAELDFPVWTYLLVWPVYGFAFAHLAGLLFRKTLVAGAVGALLGGTFAAVWMPSLLAGGAHRCQVFAPVVVTLLTARLLVWPWATDRIGTRPALRRLVIGTAAVVAAVAVGIGYRVAEVPAVPTADEHLKFAATLPTTDDQQAGRVVRRAIGQFEERKELISEKADRPVAPELPAEVRKLVGLPPADPRPPQDLRYVEQCWEVVRVGYPRNRPDFDRWLTRAAQPTPDGASWERMLAEAAAKPTGVLEDPNEMTIDTGPRHVRSLHGLGGVYLARGLLAQHNGDPEDFARRLPVWLATLRTARKQTIATVQATGYAYERSMYQAVDRWLDRLDGRPDLLRVALAAVLAHDAADVIHPEQTRLAEQVVAWNAVSYPALWLPRYLDSLRPWEAGRWDRLGTSRTTEAESELVAFAWAVPWERERLRRVHGLGNTAQSPGDPAAFARGAPGWQLTTARYFPEQSVSSWRRSATIERLAAIVKLAVRLYHAETGQYPPSLAELTPKYIPEGLTLSAGWAVFEYRFAANRVLVDQNGLPVERIARGQPVFVARIPNVGYGGGPIPRGTPGSTGIEGGDLTQYEIQFPVPLPSRGATKR
ncbi:MAG: hypothetical protein U0871_04810 [Gemmataceae bacterium]